MTKLNWQGDDNRKIAYYLGIEYTIQANDKGKFNVTERYLGQERPNCEHDLNSMEQAMRWAEEAMLPLLTGEPVSEPVSDILKWFKLAKPKPDYNNFLTQYACHIEEFLEMLVATGANEHEQYRFYEQLGDYCNDLKTLKVPEEYHELQASFIDKTELLDSLCDQIVTALGVGYMFGFDMQSALKEVIRSNWSKFENGKPIFDENGKIAKPASYSKPNLEPFLGVSHDAN